MSEKLKIEFKNIFEIYSNDYDLLENYWTEIENKYNSKTRCYHNLTHLENMITELYEVKNNIKDFDTILFSVFYHDIIYKSTAKDNEEKSAKIAQERLCKIELSENQLSQVFNQIIATKNHRSTDLDTNYLLDADLCIPGKSWKLYEEYTQQIRKEYAIYPDFLYKSGRKKVLIHFLKFEKIYKTCHFNNKYEDQARLNIQKEIDLL